MSYAIETNLALGQLDDCGTTPDILEPFRAALNAMSGGALVVDPLTNIGSSGAVLMSRLTAGTIQFAYGSSNRIPVPSNPLVYAHLFGMEVQEFCSWWYGGAGAAHIASQIATLAPPANNLYVFPVNCAPGESGGWYKEAVTMKKMLDGKWSDGSQIKLRLADECGPTHLLAFPNVTTPPPVLSGSWLQDAKNGVYNGGELFSPLGDSSLVNGMFPNYPNVTGSIIDAGIKHYYIQTWQTPFRGRCLYVNKAFFDTVLTAAQQEMVTSAAYKCHMQIIANQLQGQDAIIKQFQLLGGIIHEKLPSDYLMSLRSATDEIYRQNSVADLTGFYGATLAHQRDFIRKNHVRWQSGNLDRTWRFKSRLNYESDLHPDTW